MDTLTESEIAAIQAASVPAGEFLESIKKTNLAELTEAEWFTFLEAVCVSSWDSLVDHATKNIPFPELVAQAEKAFTK